MENIIKIVVGKTLSEWEAKFGDNDDLWDVSIEDLENGGIEPNTECYYWLINGRLYETDIWC